MNQSTTSIHRTHAAALHAANRAAERTGRRARVARERVIGTGRLWVATDPEGVAA